MLTPGAIEKVLSKGGIGCQEGFRGWAMGSNRDSGQLDNGRLSDEAWRGG